jgi:hypothetical protein
MLSRVHRAQGMQTGEQQVLTLSTAPPVTGTHAWAVTKSYNS